MEHLILWNINESGFIFLLVQTRPAQWNKFTTKLFFFWLTSHHENIGMDVTWLTVHNQMVKDM